MKYVGSKARLSKQLAPIIQSYIDGMGDSCNCNRCHAYELKFQSDGKNQTHGDSERAESKQSCVLSIGRCKRKMKWRQIWKTVYTRLTKLR